MIVVTGAAGFIGSRLRERLSLLGLDAKFLDVHREKNITRVDVTDQSDLQGVFSEGDIVIHLAALVNAHESDFKKKDYFKTNVEGTFNVINACERARCKKIVFLSSVAVYDPAFIGIINERSPTAPSNFYGVTKLLGETLVSNSTISNTILRLANVYGPGGKGILNLFMKRAISEEVLEVWGTGKQERDFTHVDDAVDAILLATKIENGIYNVATGKNTNILNLAEQCVRLSGSESKIKFSQKYEEEIHYNISSKKLQKLGWKPSINVETGMRGLL